MGFPHEKDVIKSSKKSYEVEFKVLGPSDIQAEQDVQIHEVASILEQSQERSAVLLRFLRWNKERLIEKYMEKPDELLEAAGLGPEASEPPKILVMSGFRCDICYEDGAGLETYAMKCGHRYCRGCYQQYLIQKIKEEGEAARIQCPTNGCNRIVPSTALKFLVTDDLKTR